jgi:MipA family protein
VKILVFKAVFYPMAAALALIFSTGFALADQKPLWEAGAGISGLRLPVYRGSDEFKNLALPLPYFVYRGERFKLDREGGRGLLFKSDVLELDVSVGGTFPVSSNNQGARVNMPGLKATLEVGPLLIASLWRSEDKNTTLTARIPLRGVMTSSLHGAGFVFQPQLAYDIKNLAGSQWTVGARGGPVFQSANYAQYFYGVDQAYATSTRPQYKASSGYGGYNLLVGGSKRFENTWLGAFVKYDNLASASFADSPLVKKRQYFTLGIAFSWIFGQSPQMVEADD